MMFLGKWVEKNPVGILPFRRQGSLVVLRCLWLFIYVSCLFGMLQIDVDRFSSVFVCQGCSGSFSSSACFRLFM